MNIASYLVKAGDVVAVREKAKKQLRIIDAVKLAEGQGMPAWVRSMPPSSKASSRRRLTATSSAPTSRKR